MSRKHSLRSLLTNRISGSILILLLLFAAPVVAGQINGPTEPLFITANVSGASKILEVLGSTVTSWNAGPYDDAIAVAGGYIRTMPLERSLSSPQPTGYEYDASNGDRVGPPPSYENPVTTGASGFYDGTTDGVQHNYSVAYSSLNGDLWRFDRNWANPQFMFAIDPNPDQWEFNSITYYNGKLWSASQGSSPLGPYPAVWEIDPGTGARSAVFGLTFPESDRLGGGSYGLHVMGAKAAAMDSQGIFWVLSSGYSPQSGYLFAYDSSTGAYLGHRYYSALDGVGISGAEFGEGAVPEPSTCVLLGGALLGVLALRRRQA